MSTIQPDVADSGIIAGTTPYPWPYDADLTRSRVSLVVLGWSEFWWQRCAAPAAVVGPIVRLAAAVGSVIAVEQLAGGIHRPLADPVGHGTPPTLPGAQVLSAVGIDGFYGSPLDAVLRADRRDQLLLVGLGLETTVHSTMRSANDRGYECLLVVDACAPLDPGVVPYATSMVEMSGGIFGAVGTTDHVLAALGGEPFPGGTS